MEKNDLILYLEQQKAERIAEANRYELAKEELELAQKALEQAQKKVDEFGDISAIPAEIEKINGFIDFLQNENNTVEVTVD